MVSAIILYIPFPQHTVHKHNICVFAVHYFHEKKMVNIKCVLSIVIVLGVSSSYDAGPTIAVYWGPNSAGTCISLSDICQNTNYDLVIVSFVNNFYNRNEPPKLNITCHNANLSLVAHQIKQCQDQGKQVLISLGGYGPGTYYVADSDAEVFARVIWQMFLGGQNNSVHRPFGKDVNLDGVDLFIRKGKQSGYAILVKNLLSWYRKSTSKYYVSGSPECYWSDPLGPQDNSTALAEEGKDFNFVNIQYYNRPCFFNKYNPSSFISSWKKWTTWRSSLKTGPKLRVGLTCDRNNLYEGYVQRSDLHHLFMLVCCKACDLNNFSGVSLWDASLCNNNIDNNQTYTDYLYQVLNEVCNYHVWTK